MVCLKQNKPKQSLDVATNALKVDSTNVKALYRRAAAHRRLGDPDAARLDLKEALSHDPANREVKRELLSIRKELDAKKRKEQNALARAFSNTSGSSSFLYDDKEEEEKRKAEERNARAEAEKEAQKKRKAQWEEECVQLLARGEKDKVTTFEEWEKERKKKEEEEDKARKKARKEEEAEKRRKERGSRKSSANAAAAKSTDGDNSDDEEFTEEELKMFRGYKKTADGRTTSYFNREQTDEEKKLLGSIVPQRIQTTPNNQDDYNNAVPSPIATSPVDANSAQIASAWNQAGTWEEKNTTDWCNSSLQSFLKNSSANFLSYIGKVTEVKDLSGDASVAFSRGKKRYVFDFHCTLKYNILDKDTDDVLASGTINLPDISSTSIDDELEIEISSWKKAPNASSLASITECRQLLVTQIRLQVLAFVSEFNRQY